MPDTVRLRCRQLIAIAIVGQVMPDLAVISHAQRQLIGERIFSDQGELVDVSGLRILRPNRIQENY